MKHLEKENKNLMNLRTSLIPTVVVLTGGIVGLFLSDINIWAKIFLDSFGLYLDFLFIHNIVSINKRIDYNIGVINDECK